MNANQRGMAQLLIHMAELLRTDLEKQGREEEARELECYAVELQDALNEGN
jgi:hypothetical protein